MSLFHLVIFFFFFLGGTGRREGGWVWTLPCIAKAHFHGRKKSSPLWALNSISSYCVYSPTLTLFLREMISFADVERNTSTKDHEDFYKKQGDGAYRCATDQWGRERREYCAEYVQLWKSARQWGCCLKDPRLVRLSSEARLRWASPLCHPAGIRETQFSESHRLIYSVSLKYDFCFLPAVGFHCAEVVVTGMGHVFVIRR